MCTSSPKIPKQEPVQPTIIYAPSPVQRASYTPEPVEPVEPEPAPKASKPTTEAAIRARQEQATRVSKKKGYLGSILTSGMGVDTTAETEKKKLLGGTE